MVCPSLERPSMDGAIEFVQVMQASFKILLCQDEMAGRKVSGGKWEDKWYENGGKTSGTKMAGRCHVTDRQARGGTQTITDGVVS